MGRELLEPTEKGDVAEKNYVHLHSPKTTTTLMSNTYLRQEGNALEIQVIIQLHGEKRMWNGKARKGKR